MLISDEQFKKFKKLYKEEFGEEKYNKMTEQQLLESATKLLKLVEIVYKPIESQDSQNRLDEAYNVLFKETEKELDNGRRNI